ncbi:MAG: hypothetical protein RBS39_00800 [Phycisphaerales bacterium]|jgi:hypothetical protein|nr:hypothetical protein [Phycisphaerales bacterium]
MFEKVGTPILFASIGALAGALVGCATNDGAQQPARNEQAGQREVGATNDPPAAGSSATQAAQSPAQPPAQPSAQPSAQAAKPAAQPSAQSQPQSQPGEFTRIDDDPRAGPPEWFTSTPVLEDGRLTLSADASARTAREARAAAVDAGVARLRASLGFDPRDSSVLLTHVERLPTGWFRAYVMMTANANEQ